MIQDIAPSKFYNSYFARRPKETDYILIFHENELLVQKDEGILRFMKKSVFNRFIEGKKTNSVNRYQYLFSIDKDDYFLYMDFCIYLEETELKKLKYDFQEMSAIRSTGRKEFCFIAYTAYHLYQWYRDNQFCGRCGSQVYPDKKERMLYCMRCGNQIYPKIAPAVIVAVADGNRLLLTKYAGRDYKNYALIAGFIEIGETAEDAIRREVMEEAGLQVKNIRYYKTQPWGIASNLLIGYFAELDGDNTICFDKEELAEAVWMDRKDLYEMDDGFSLTREMIRIFYEGKV